MKKIISVIVVAVLTCSFTMLCQASDMYDKQAGLEEIEKLSSEILEFVNSGYRGVYDGEPAEEKDIDFYSIQIAQGKESAEHFRIMAAPTLLFIKDGQVVERTVGVQKLADLKAIVEKLVVFCKVS